VAGFGFREKVGFAAMRLTGRTACITTSRVRFGNRQRKGKVDMSKNTKAQIEEIRARYDGMPTDDEAVYNLAQHAVKDIPALINLLEKSEEIRTAQMKIIDAQAEELKMFHKEGQK